MIFAQPELGADTLGKLIYPQSVLCWVLPFFWYFTSTASQLSNWLDWEPKPSRTGLPLLSGNYTQGLAHNQVISTVHRPPSCHPESGRFQGIPHSLLEAKQGCVLALSHSTGEWHLKSPFPEKSCHFSIGKSTCFDVFFSLSVKTKIQKPEMEYSFNSSFFHLGDSFNHINQAAYFEAVHSCPPTPLLRVREQR